MSLLSLTSEWFIVEGLETEALAAVAHLAQQVRSSEPDTLVYLVHTQRADSPDAMSTPPARARSIVFFEVYRDIAAFVRHVSGPVFTTFLETCGRLFVARNGAPYTTVAFLDRLAGFLRTEALQSGAGVISNRHPAVMFEIIASDQVRALQFYEQVFGWSWQFGTGNFGYVHFPFCRPALLGGVGKANTEEPGFKAGTYFYLEVDGLEEALERVEAHGGARYVEPTSVDGYRFAMFKDPEGNVIGLIEPFGA